jgi:cysteine-rich repeat protein
MDMSTIDLSTIDMSGPRCGDGVRDPGEECDDGNVINLDGCSGRCRFEPVQRTTSFHLESVSDANCAADALGHAFGLLAQPIINQALASGVSAGNTGFLGYFVDLGQPSGLVDQASLTAALFTAQPTTTAGGYSGTADLDWWYAASPASLGPDRIPTARLSGSLAGGALVLGPGNVSMPFSFGGPLVPASFSHLVVKTMLALPTAPLQSTNGMPPGYVAADHLDPALIAFPSTTKGVLCGNISAATLARLDLALNLGNACPPYQTYLDWVVGGCVGAIGGVTATQPDQVDPTKPVAGAGPPYRLAISAGRVTSCFDRLDAPVALDACLESAAYSVYFTFATDRVIVRK